jgi:mono/diheme cytochrome c family protein
MGRFRRWVVVGAVLASSAVLLAAQLPGAAQSAPSVDFVRDIEPIFKQYCYECHGPEKARAGLQLHTPDLIYLGGDSGAIYTPGKSAESELIRRIMAASPDDRMPRDAEPLPPAAIALLRAWIDQGAAMPMPAAPATPARRGQDHWAYVPPKRPELPPVINGGWERNAIDRFVLSRLERERLTPSGDAGKSTLLRRVTLDLTGLPPTPDEVAAFLADRSPDAYDKVVDRLLASPHYGERWARPWLDLARYADTNGHEKDSRRDIWKYRDWVIDALNRDMPFDQFTVEQIAGDMLPNATTEQKIASGFHRNAMTNEEGGVDPDESLYEVLVDRVNTTATVWLGTTLACAQCHSHKYDPLPQKDYYRMLAFFANTEYETRVAGDGTRFSEARLDLATPEQEQARARAQAEIDRLDRELRAVTPAFRDEQAHWEQSMRTAEGVWTAVPARDAAATNGVELKPLPDGSVLASGANPALTSYTLTADTTLQGITGLRLEALPDASLPRGGPGRDGYGHFRVTGLQVEIAPITRSPEPSLRSPGPSGPGTVPVSFKTLKVDDSAYAFQPADLLGRAGAAAKAGEDRKGGSWAINAMRDVDRVARHAVLVAETPFGFPEGTRITVRIHHLDGTIGQGIGRVRLSVTTAADPLAGADVPARLRPVLDLPIDRRTAAQASELATFFRPLSPGLKPTRDALAAARKTLADLQIPSTLVMKEKPSFERPSYEVRVRGAFTSRGERVFAGTPGALHPMRDDQPVNRLGLARWLVDDRNPLVARVTMNRLWEQVFGRGLVETSEDFGSQGSPPSHPDLLDWLATEFMATGWSQKAMLRQIVTSSTYRQSSVVTRELVERDPYNRLLARGPRFRMEAEMVRDVALAASGLLSRKMHGPSVFPLQPPGIWNQPYSTEKWTTSEGEDRHRRSLYSFWRRTSPYPSAMTFDATSREFCTVRRVRTNTPLQALTLLNDPASFEAARALARRMVSVADARSRVSLGMTLVLARPATPAELDRLVALYRSERAHYLARPQAAAQVLAETTLRPADAAELAAWTIVANVLLNLDEAVTKQ